jgi:thioesterase domain-containing protein
MQVEDIYDLSPLQLELLNQLPDGPGASAHVCQTVCRLGHLNEQLFWQAWGKVVERHSVLRTSFHRAGLNKPIQVVHRKAETPTERLDWCGLSPAEQKARLESFLSRDRGQVLDPARAPMMRWALLRLTAGAYYLVWSYHPLILDPETARLVFDEVLALYASLGQGKDPGLPGPGRFRDYVATVRERGLEAAEEFWRQVLRGFTVPTPLPRDDKDDAAAAKTPGQHQRLWLPPPLMQRLLLGAQRHGVTVATLLQAAWAIVLGGQRSGEDVVFGLSVPGGITSVPGSVPVAGPFRNTLPVRIKLAAKEPLGTWLRQLQTCVEKAQAYDFIPPGRIRSCSEVPPGGPLYRAVFAVEPRSVTTVDSRPGAGGLQARAVQTVSRHPDYLLVLSGAPERGGLLLRLGPAASGHVLQRLRIVLRRLAQAASNKPLGKVVTLQRRRSAALVCLRAQGQRPAFFCIHGAGGGVLGYAALSRQLGPQQPFYAFDEAQGGHSARQPQPSVEEMAACNLEALCSAQPKGPYFLGGWSAGGLVAYEMARQLAGRGQEVALLALFDTAVPDPDQEVPGPRKVLVRLARQLGLDLADRPGLREASADELLAVFVREGRASSLLPAGMGEAELRRQVRLYRGHAEAALAYSPLPYSGCVTLFRAAAGAAKGGQPAHLGWDRLAADVDLRLVPGNHDTMLREPHVQTLAAQLADCLAAQASRSIHTREAGCP